ncbi:hypothetical protein [uncultured Methanobacterium sp.]|nr:hypothetical protein [uncultured Methanobacterium sp.]
MTIVVVGKIFGGIAVMAVSSSYFLGVRFLGEFLGHISLKKD